ncbi:MAG: DUF4397 domain-containing protein [Anaerolineae bacterium]|nr:DUF4397 domain-containing protein [Anaerolineae bacterium]
MKKLITIAAILVLAILAACTPEAPLPTSVPTNTPPPPTATSDATPTLAPTATEPRGIRSLPTQDASIATATPTPEPATGTVQFIHAIPDLLAVNYRITERTLANSLSYSRYTLPIELLTGQYTIEVVLTDGDGSVLASQPLTILDDQSVLMVLTGTADAPRLVAINEDTSPIAGNVSRVMVFNGIDTQFPLIIQNGNEPVTPSLPHTASSPFFEVAAGDVSLNVMEAMTPVALISDQFRARELNSVFLLPNQENPEEVDIITITKLLDGLGQVRVIGVTDPAYYDVYLDNKLIASNIGAAIDTEFEEWVAGEYVAAVYPTGSDPATSRPEKESNVSIAPDRSVSLVISGSDDTLSINEVPEDLSPTAPNEARIVFVNAVDQYNRVQLNAQDDTYILFYGQATEPTMFDARESSFSWIDYATRSESNVIEATFDYSLEAGQSYLYILDNPESTQPRIFASEVGIEAALAPELLPDDVADVVSAARLRVVNAAQDSTVELSLDDVVFAGAQGYATVTNPYAMQPGDHVLTARDPETDQLLARDITPYEAGGSYSAYIYKGVNGDFRFLVIADELRQPNLAPVVRQVNLTENELTLGLMSNLTSLDAGPPNTVMSAIAGPDERRTAPYGLTEINRSVEPAEASAWFAVPQLRDANDYYVLEPDSGDILVTLENVRLDTRQLYEFVSFGNSLSNEVAVFVVPYQP